MHAFWASGPPPEIITPLRLECGKEKKESQSRAESESLRRRERRAPSDTVHVVVGSGLTPSLTTLHGEAFDSAAQRAPPIAWQASPARGRRQWHT